MSQAIRCPRCGWRFRAKVPAGSVKEQLAEEGYPNAFKVWGAEEDQQLAKMQEEGAAVLMMARALGRPPTAIRRRLEILGLSVPKAPAPQEEAQDKAYQLPDEPTD
jgi:hypothetical protein